MPDIKISELDTVTETKTGDLVTLVTETPEGVKSNVNITVGNLLAGSTGGDTLVDVGEIDSGEIDFADGEVLVVKGIDAPMPTSVNILLKYNADTKIGATVKFIRTKNATNVDGAPVKLAISSEDQAANTGVIDELWDAGQWMEAVFTGQEWVRTQGNADIYPQMTSILVTSAAFNVDIHAFNGREGVVKIPDSITDPVVLSIPALADALPGTRITVCSLTEFTCTEIDGLQGGGSGTIETLTVVRYPDDTVGGGDWVQTM